MNKDTLVLRKEGPAASGWKPLTVSVEVYNAVKVLAEETGMSQSKVAVAMLEFALERVVVEK